MALPPVTALSVDPIRIGVAVACAAAVALVLRRGEPSRRRRRWISLATGATLLAAIWFSPLDTLARHYLLSAHLLQITILMGAVPPALLLALPRRSSVHLPRLVGRCLRLVVHPLVAIVAVNAAFFGWHLSGPYGAAMASAPLYSLEQVCLLLTSIAFWWPIITPLSTPARGMTPLGRMGYIVLATIPQTLGGLAVALAHHSLYPAYAAAPRLLGLDVMTDQQIAGASIALVSKIALFAAFTIIFLRLLASDDAPSGDDGGGGGGGGSRRDIAPRPLPSGTPRWLHDLNRGRTVPEPQPVRPRVRQPAGAGSPRR